MNIKKQAPKMLSVLLSFTMAFSSLLPAYATDVIISESTLESTELNKNEGEDLRTFENRIKVQADSNSSYEEIEVNYSQSSSYYVTIPKTITLGSDKKSPYSVKVEGDIAADKQVCVVPVDGISKTEVFDFYMEDLTAGSTKEDVVAEVNQTKFYWNHEEAAAGYEENDNYIIADGLSAGRWKGTFQIEISMRTAPSHIHNYVGEVTKEPTCTEEGEKTYSCSCGDSYTEKIPATGHSFVDGECENCGEKDPNHEHSYTEKITKEPTCTEEGEKTYTCSCGDSYTEKIPATGHSFVDGECENCGEKDHYEVAPVNAYINWDYTLDDVNDVITLNYYKGSETDVIVYANYVLNGKTYKTQIASNVDRANSYSNYMFNGGAWKNCQNIKSIKFSDNIDTSNTRNMSYMFFNCQSLSSIDLGGLDTDNVTNMSSMFSLCKSLTNIDVSSLDTSNVTNMNSIFSYCQSLTSLDLSKINTCNVMDMSSMFQYCNVLENINLYGFNTGNATSMNNMFCGCKSLTSLDLSSFDTSKVKDMSNMFNNCTGLESLDLSNFNTSSVINMSSMFYGCNSLNNIDVSSFDTGNVTSTLQMFYGCSAILSLDLSSFNTSNVTRMDSMFNTCQNLTTIYVSSGKWTTSRATTTLMFDNCGTKTVTYK